MVNWERILSVAGVAVSLGLATNIVAEESCDEEHAALEACITDSVNAGGNVYEDCDDEADAYVGCVVNSGGVVNPDLLSLVMREDAFNKETDDGKAIKNEEQATETEPIKGVK